MIHRNPPAGPDETFDALVAEASAVNLVGWDFSFLAGRTNAESLPWSYLDLARKATRRATRMLDIDTGGGEMLASIRPPAGSIAVEPFPPNIPVAAAALSRLGVEVRPRTGGVLPVAGGQVDLVLNRHGALDPHEIVRVLQPGGVLLTQQVGPRNDNEFNEAFGIPPVSFGGPESLAEACEMLEAAGLAVMRAEEAWPRTSFLDVGAVVLQLRAVSWQVPGFDVHQYQEPLHRIHQQILRNGAFTVTSHRILLMAKAR